ncbi:citrate synthase/methylcitrate synthase [Devosia algicola]|uniref:citrate synthase (unknown stereospecificity) n=1 Tax=Devosia algicola TaxID=3026418 RepID=A0ABY7YKR2_9HYPH|nr:citrate synthase/methylcitrate synthase [Devosia algicola]WDR01886.1 citrate synthase/methylcitrate synthase [Devosia algicola]
MSSGLDDVIAAETALSDVDGLQGRLIIAGHSLDALAGQVEFEAVLALLLDCDPADLKAAIGAARLRVFDHLSAVDGALLNMSPVEALRALMARLADGEDDETAHALIAAPAVFTAGLTRLRQGLSPVPPDQTLGHTADMLTMTYGRHPAPEQVAALEAYLVTVVDHGLNASTFAARVVASTRAGLTSAVLAALSALKGPLHGGAPGPVLDMLDAIGQPDNAEKWLTRALGDGERLMGFGHRIYRVRDPRADALKAALAKLAAAGYVPPERLTLAETVEATALRLLKQKKPDRPLETNVEFYTALLLESLCLPRGAFTCVFAAGRVGGWVAHAREQIATGRLMRPQSRYIGHNVTAPLGV